MGVKQVRDEIGDIHIGAVPNWVKLPQYAASRPFELTARVDTPEEGQTVGPFGEQLFRCVFLAIY